MMFEGLTKEELHAAVIAAENVAEKDARMILASEQGKRLFAWLSYKFGLKESVFHRAEGRGKHDDKIFDALIRDGNREVVAYIETLAEKAKQQDNE